jgi:hypothetical protein
MNALGRRGYSFEDCALKYAQGGARDKELAFMARIKQGVDGALLAAIATHFIVARQFPKRTNRAEDFNPAVEPFRLAATGLSKENLVERVGTFATELRDLKITKLNTKTGKHDLPTSACSKFLWCAQPNVSIIFDRRARDCLEQLGHRVPAGSYASYVTAFEEEFLRHEASIHAALPLMGLPESARPWSSRKLLDFWLYANGSLPKVG